MQGLIEYHSTFWVGVKVKRMSYNVTVRDELPKTNARLITPQYVLG